MAADSSLQHVVRRLRDVTLRRDGACLPDGELLVVFVNQHDDASFEALVRRHGAMA
jgi:hypothetical protein